MCNMDTIQKGSIKPARLDINDIGFLEQSIQDYMSKISEVVINLDHSSSPEEFVEAFRSGFKINKHNYIEKNEKGILCYDLMICQNPLEEKKKQLFYTFFSQDSVYDKKTRLASIYQHYLDFHPDYHIDTMLQICYTEDCDDIKEGFYLKFEDTGCKLISLGSSERPSKVLKSFDLKESRIVDCEPLIPSMTLLKKDGIIEKTIENLENYINQNTEQTDDEISDYIDFVNAFLDRKTPINGTERNASLRQIQKNAYRLSLINELAVPGIKCLYFMPISFPNNKQIGHFVLSTDGQDLERDREYIKKFKVLSFVLMFPLSQANMSSIFIKKAYVESVKSAKAAIMSRNMSHNLGSHVMAYLKNDLRTVPSIFASSVLHDLFPQQFKAEDSNVINNVELPFLVGLGNFIGYLQERQDYIATIASSYIPSFSPVNFKDSIYDELNPDLRFERHHRNDPENHNRPQNILLSYIAKSEKLSRIKSSDGKSHDILLGYKNGSETFGIKAETNNSDDSSLTTMRVVNFALPGGTVGRQAIFSIVENIIRNAAKHNNVQGNLELTFETIDGEELQKNPNDFCKSISTASIRTLYSHSSDIPDLLLLTITDNQECSDPTVRKLRRALRQPYVGEDSQTNKGIKEIRISATWLRGIDDDSILSLCPLEDNEIVEGGGKAPAVSIEKSDDGHLRYVIGLRKTYEFALVYGGGSDKSAFENKFQLKRGSFKTIAASSIIKSDICFEYIVAENTDVFNQIRPYVTNRCVKAEDILAGDATHITPELIYQAYTGIDESTPAIIINDDKVSDENIKFGSKIKVEKASIPCDANYIYRSHHLADKDFGAYWKDRASGNLKGNFMCIDGISGDNSSDRLVRREILDKKWYIGHLYAMKSNVAIFDERMFQIVHGLDESQMVVGTYEASALVEKCKKGMWPTTEKLSEIELENLAMDKLHIYSDTEIDTFINLYNACIQDPDGELRIDGSVISNRENLMSFLDRYAFRLKKDVEGSQHLTAAYSEKGVDIVTIIPMGRNECVIVGNAPYDYLVENEKPVYKFRFEPIARIIKDENGNFDVSAQKKYRYLSIHQGLIDKMYSEFSISDNDKNIKKTLMNKLYSEFMAEKEADINAFLPRLVIHSGRGHITKKDMPLNQPFIQYSAIEHAVLDCKYSLVELLDFAKYKE